MRATAPAASVMEAPDVVGTPRGSSRSALERAIDAVDRNCVWVLATLMLADVLLLLYMGRGLSFFFDDWDYVIHDYGGGVHSLLVPHNGHLSLVPIAIYKVLFHIAGLNHYAVFRLVVIVLHLACVALVFTLAERRLGRVPALLAATLILFLGAAWEDLLWAFQMSYLLSVAAGLAAWVLLERDGRRNEVGVMACLLVALGSSSLGIAVVIGVAAEMIWQRRWRSAWVVLVPVLLYALWYLSYGESEITKSGLINAPGFAEDLAAAAFGGLTGRSLDWGRPLALLGMLALLGVLIRARMGITSRLVGLLATGVALWVITATARSTISAPETSRYIYFGAVVIVLVGVELLQGAPVSARAIGVGAVLVVFFALTGLTVMHNGASGLRATSKTVTAELGALALASAHAPPAYQPDPQRAPQIVAGPYLHTVHAIGSSPADTPPQIDAADGVSREAADAILVALETPAPQSGAIARSARLAPAPALSAIDGGSAAQVGACVRVTPGEGATTTAAFTLPAGGVLIRDEGPVSVSLALKRFGDGFHPLAAPVAGRGTAVLSPAADAAALPWQLQTVSASPFAICGLSA